MANGEVHLEQEHAKVSLNLAKAEEAAANLAQDPKGLFFSRNVSKIVAWHISRNTRKI
jgi:hypothetical protein